MRNTVTFNGRNLTPSKVVCVGRNYVGHIKELKNVTPTEPVIFVKPNSAVSSALLLKGGDEIHFEAELSFLVEAGKLKAVGFGLDLTKRQIQNELKAKGLPWERAKAFDCSAVFSDFVTVPQSLDELGLELYVNGRLQQKGDCSMMLNSPVDLLNEVDSFMTLEDGDVLMTGTPAGVGPIHIGDVFVGKVYASNQLLIEVCWTVNG